MPALVMEKKIAFEGTRWLQCSQHVAKGLPLTVLMRSVKDWFLVKGMLFYKDSSGHVLSQVEIGDVDWKLLRACICLYLLLDNGNVV